MVQPCIKLEIQEYSAKVLEIIEKVDAVLRSRSTFPILSNTFQYKAVAIKALIQIDRSVFTDAIQRYNSFTDWLKVEETVSRNN